MADPLFGTDAELQARIEGIVGSPIFISFKEREATIGGPSLTAPMKRVKGQYEDAIKEQRAREVVVASKVAAATAATATGSGGLATDKYPPRPTMIGSKLDWKRKSENGKDFEDASAKPGRVMFPPSGRLNTT